MDKKKARTSRAATTEAARGLYPTRYYLSILLIFPLNNVRKRPITIIIGHKIDQ